jgi:hypothetical protein
MSEAKYTPGPWYIKEDLNKHGHILVWGSNKNLVADSGSYRNPEEINKANAHLIAAAPDLL